MSSRSPDPSKETIIPISVVFITVGLIILLTALMIWAAAPLQLPDRVELAVAPLRSPTATPSTAVGQALEPAVVLLPETPLVGLDLPSFAEAASAPRINHAALPGQPVRLVIPKIELDAPIQRVDLEEAEYEGQTFYQWAVPIGHRVGWHSDSALLGKPGNTVFNGHHNIYGQVFRDLIELEVGDEIFIYNDEGSFVYQVSEQKLMPERGEPLEVRIRNASWIEETGDERITLVTCWPFADNSHRLIVVALPVRNN